MPYIDKVGRDKLEVALEVFRHLVSVEGLSNGELNYLMTNLGLMYLVRHGESYNTISDVIKAL